MGNIIISPHAADQMSQRGAAEAEVIAAITEGISEPARKDRKLFRMNFPFDAEWSGQHYRTKQVAPVVVEEAATLIVVTVYVFYF